MNIPANPTSTCCSQADLPGQRNGGIHRLALPSLMPSSPWSGLPARMISMHPICLPPGYLQNFKSTAKRPAASQWVGPAHKADSTRQAYPAMVANTYSPTPDGTAMGTSDACLVAGMPACQERTKSWRRLRANRDEPAQPCVQPGEVTWLLR
jgi:hypothetical protein